MYALFNTSLKVPIYFKILYILKGINRKILKELFNKNTLSLGCWVQFGNIVQYIVNGILMDNAMMHTSQISSK